MSIRKPAFVLPISLTLALAACTLGQSAPAISPVDAAATIVAMTLEAADISTSPAPVTPASASPEPATPTATTKPTLKIGGDDVSCRSSPAASADIIASFSNGTVVDLIARNEAEGYWLVKDPDSGSSCWVPMQDASASGGFQSLPEVTQPAAVSSDVPAAPAWGAVSNAWRYECAAGSVTVTLQWTDRADNETGYRIYRNQELIAELPAGSTFYTDTTDAGSGLSYGIQAYNDAGESGSLGTGSFSCG